MFDSTEDNITTGPWEGLPLFAVIPAELDAPPTEKGPGFSSSPICHRAIQLLVVVPEVKGGGTKGDQAQEDEHEGNMEQTKQEQSRPTTRWQLQQDHKGKEPQGSTYVSGVAGRTGAAQRSREENQRRAPKT